MTNDEFYDVVGCIIHDPLGHKLDVALRDNEVDTILRHFPNGKSLSWDDNK